MARKRLNWLFFWSLLLVFLVGCGPAAEGVPTATAVPAPEVSLGVIGDYVWVDENEDGLQNGSEPGLHDVPVQLFGADDTLIDSTLTDANGFYKFVGVASGSYYLKFKAQDYLGFTKQDVGEDDAVDSDAAKSTGRTDVFSYTVGDGDINKDAGTLVESWDGCIDCHTRPTKTPRPTKEPPPPTPTVWRVITHGGKREVNMAFGASSGNCTNGPAFADLFEIIIGDDLISIEFYQPSSGNRNTGTLEPNGEFSIQSADGKETYTGTIYGDWSGMGLNTYVHDNCTWEMPVEWTPVEN